MKKPSLEKQIADLNDDIIAGMMKRRALSGPNDYPEWEKTHNDVLESVKRRDRMVASLPPAPPAAEVTNEFIAK